MIPLSDLNWGFLEILFLVIVFLVGLLITYYLLPYIIKLMKKKNYVGYDIHKNSRPEVAESALGAAAGGAVSYHSKKKLHAKMETVESDVSTLDDKVVTLDGKVVTVDENVDALTASLATFVDAQDTSNATIIETLSTIASRIGLKLRL